ncbi:MAG: AAA family ATPase [Planctomycetes bacterium]|nr:AAA family ATPase [Planctomycetota bacterium]
MIKGFGFIRSVGCFDTCQGTTDTEFQPLTLVYAENGRGKTTLVAILRSMAENQPHWVLGRRRLGSEQDPHIVIDLEGGGNCVFQNDSWSSTFDSVLIFDDHFVDDNVFSGLTVGPDHRQNLHEVILGSQGVHLKRRVDELTERISQLNDDLRDARNAIPRDALEGLDVDAFCDLPMSEDAETRSKEITRQLAALQQSGKVQSIRFFSCIDFPVIDIDSVQELLHHELGDLDSTAVEQVQEHFTHLGADAENWVSDGISRIYASGPPENEEQCPFCAQSVSGIDLVDHYRAYFGEAYRDLQDRMNQTSEEFQAALGGDSLARCQRELGQLMERYTFWKQHVALPEFALDLEPLSEAWTAAREGVAAALSRKGSSPLDSHDLADGELAALREYSEITQRITVAIEELVAQNDAITALKKTTEASDVGDLTEELQRLNAATARHSEEIAPLCEAYIRIRDEKKNAEREKVEAREQLDAHRTNSLPAYKTKVNFYLQRFGAGFRLGEVVPQDRAGRASTSYHLVIRDVDVPLVGRGEDDSQPCFKTALSSGDRNTLALSFFFASAELDSSIADKVLIIDDPVSSLDDGRITNTVSEIRAFGRMAKQIIVLSHAKPFLCRIHKHADPQNTTCLMLQRVADNASQLVQWEPSEDQFTLYDHRHKLLREFRAGTAPNIRQVAEALRPIMEGYLRVAFPEQCPPGTLLGPFRNHARNLADNGTPIMDANRLQELAEITEYANKFHHDTNPAWETEHISDAELLTFSECVLAFVTH